VASKLNNEIIIEVGVMKPMAKSSESGESINENKEISA